MNLMELLSRPLGSFLPADETPVIEPDDGDGAEGGSGSVTPEDSSDDVVVVPPDRSAELLAAAERLNAAADRVAGSGGAPPTATAPLTLEAVSSMGQEAINENWDDISKLLEASR